MSELTKQIICLTSHLHCFPAIYSPADWAPCPKVAITDNVVLIILDWNSSDDIQPVQLYQVEKSRMIPSWKGIQNALSRVPLLDQKSIPMFEIEAWEGIVPCYCCDGKGKEEHDCFECGQSIPCEECKGKGEVQGLIQKSLEETKLFGLWFARHYLSIVSNLPNVSGGINDKGYLYFRFDGGEGCLMPMDQDRVEKRRGKSCSTNV